MLEGALDVEYTDEILTILGAFGDEEVRAALRQYNSRRQEARIAEGWRIWTEDGPPPKPYEWRRLGKVTYYREPRPVEAHPSPKPKPRETAREGQTKTDVSVRPNPGMSCPYCGSETFYEPLCPGCKEGRAGMSARIICGDDSNHVFYVPRSEGA